MRHHQSHLFLRWSITHYTALSLDKAKHQTATSETNYLFVVAKTLTLGKCVLFISSREPYELTIMESTVTVFRQDSQNIPPPPKEKSTSRLWLEERLEARVACARVRAEIDCETRREVGREIQGLRIGNWWGRDLSVEGPNLYKKIPKT